MKARTEPFTARVPVKLKQKIERICKGNGYSPTFPARVGLHLFAALTHDQRIAALKKSDELYAKETDCEK